MYSGIGINRINLNLVSSGIQCNHVYLNHINFEYVPPVLYGNVIQGPSISIDFDKHFHGDLFELLDSNGVHLYGVDLFELLVADDTHQHDNYELVDNEGVHLYDSSIDELLVDEK